MASLYDLLGVSRDASQEDIRRAYKARARELHPDKRGNNDNNEDEDDEEATTARFVEMKSAFDVLSDEVTRREYDESLAHRSTRRKGSHHHHSHHHDHHHHHHHSHHHQSHHHQSHHHSHRHRQSEEEGQRRAWEQYKTHGRPRQTHADADRKRHKDHLHQREHHHQQQQQQQHSQRARDDPLAQFVQAGKHGGLGAKELRSWLHAQPQTPSHTARQHDTTVVVRWDGAHVTQAQVEHALARAGTITAVVMKQRARGQGTALVMFADPAGAANAVRLGVAGELGVDADGGEWCALGVGRVGGGAKDFEDVGACERRRRQERERLVREMEEAERAEAAGAS